MTENIKPTEIIKPNLDRKATYEKRHTLFKKKKGLFKDYQHTADFKEPIGILLRRGRKAEWLEDLKQGTLVVDHSDGTTRPIILDTKYLIAFPYGKKVFQGYLLHEDFPTPLPPDPVLTAETVGHTIDKTLNDMKKWKAEEWQAKGDYYWKLFAGVGMLIGLYLLYKLLFDPTPVGQEVQVIKETIISPTGS